MKLDHVDRAWAAGNANAPSINFRILDVTQIQRMEAGTVAGMNKF